MLAGRWRSGASALHRCVAHQATQAIAARFHRGSARTVNKEGGNALQLPARAAASRSSYFNGQLPHWTGFHGAAVAGGRALHEGIGHGPSARAALKGDLEGVKRARENGCDWDKWTCANAAFGGHLEALKWARENGCDWDAWTCAYAARGGHLEVLKWARENGCDWNKRTCANAAA